jgi:hypothetical protein
MEAPTVRIVPRDRLSVAELSWGLLGLVFAATGLLKAYLPAVADQVVPGCFLRTVVGVRCPTCGTGRALALLAGGHVNQALRSNWLAVALGVGLLLFVLYLALTFALRRRIAVTLGRGGAWILAGLGLIALALAWIFQGP